jgi:XkdW protein
MMTLYDKIKTLYPELTERDFTTVITLQNDSDGKGDYIARWEHPTLAKPTDEQLAGVQ